MTQTSSNPANDANNPGHEADAVNPRLVVLSGLGLVLLVALVLLLINGVMAFLHGSMSPSKEAVTVDQSESQLRGPRLSPNEPQQLKELREAEDQRLNSYEWIDKEAGVARIPIHRAMEIFAKNGLPMTKPKSKDTENDKSQ